MARRALSSGAAPAPTWNSAVAIILAGLLFTVLATYATHQRFADAERASGEAAWGPSHQNELAVLDLPTTAPAPCSPCPSLRLNESDVEFLRNEISSIIASLPAAQALQDAPEGAAAAAFLLPGEGPDGAGALPPSDPQIIRLADESHRPNPTSNIPGVQDVHAELREYTEHMLNTWMSEENISEAFSRQHRPSARELGLQVEDRMDELASLSTRIEFLNELAVETAMRAPVRVAIATTTATDLAGVRRELLPWLQYHTELGVTHFYILYDGADADAVESLRALRHVKLIHIHQPWATAADQALWETQARLSKLWQERKGNYELMAKQGFCLQEALRRANLAGVNWLMHLDPDELFLPGGRGGSLAAELAIQPAYVPAVRFLNFEGQPEVGDVTNPFEQVTLFRVHKHFITPEAFWYRNRFKLGQNAAFLYLYANGKSAVRVDAPGVRHSGPHYFTGAADSRWKTRDNSFGAWINYVSDTSVVLHYAYSRPAEVAAKAHRSCPGNVSAAVVAGKWDREAVKKECFVIDFDVDAFMAALFGQPAIEEFFYSRMVLSEGSPVRCTRPADHRQGWCALHAVPRLVHLLEKIGLFRRVLLPQMVMQQHERLIQRRIKSTT